MPRMPPSDIHLQSPRQWSPISYAFLGDGVWELYIRRLFFAPPSRPLEYDLKCKRAVRAEAQDLVLRHLIDADFFSDDELGIVKWGRNASYGNTPQRLRGKGKGGFAIYRNASALECVVGYMYMTDLARLEEMMAGLGGDGVLEKIAAEGKQGGAGKGMVKGGIGKPKKVSKN
jgi:ribonuclease-3 family protein